MMKLTEEDIDRWDVEGHQGIWIPAPSDGIMIYAGSPEAEKRIKEQEEWTSQTKAQILENQKLRELIEAEQKNQLVFGTSESVNQMHWKQEFIKRLLDQSKE